ncbi:MULTISPECIES: hypothetical protein [Pseudomonadota]|uniref:hypothetical protein n=1 Tax=Pseudomonadota TaxID=1224 RepID=UPI001CD76544|nr:MULTISPECIES: hypothetical protein [Pseudomonadota]MCA1510338.1 hypothetical protein [Bradyrhizobium sp. NBAIM01]MCE4093543.1 hypothetical protein [Klebsiella pneumoniae]
MAKTFPAVAAVLAFAIVAGSNILSGFMSDYLACGLASAASCVAWRSSKRRFVNRAHREMVRLYGSEWR